MLNKLSAIIVMIGLVALAGCKTESEKIASDMLDIQKKMLSTLKDVKDEASAKTASASMKSIMQEVSAVMDKAIKAKANEAEMTAAQDKYKGEMETVNKGIQAEFTRIAKLGPKVAQALDSSAMGGFGGGFGK